ncbi:MAG: transglutaminase-like cysteine peptidase [Sedimenticola sp.]|nr:transglutaminase-like cysteine peptidase [Sedimenticola sp.]
MASNAHRAKKHPYLNRSTALLALVLLFFTQLLPAKALFGYSETKQDKLEAVTHWVQLLIRHIKEDTPEGNCSSREFNRCHLNNWMIFIDQIRSLPKHQQITAINQYANKKEYVIDLENYATPDYWAIVKEFLFQGGDCEDYAITKLFTMRELGYDIEMARIVVLQDTNLNIPHAVLALYVDGDILILDNQLQTVVSHSSIAHYIPLYAVNENAWWIYTPPY